MKKYIGYIIIFLLFIVISILAVVFSIRILNSENIDIQLYIESTLALITGVICLGLAIFVILLFISGRKNK